MIRYHEVLVAALCLGGKPPVIVHVDFALLQHFYVQLVHRVISRWWLTAIKSGNFKTWTGLKYNNAHQYCPSADETIKGHMVQSLQNVPSTKIKDIEADIVKQQFKQQFTGVGYGTKM